jgi:hypothetical protein
MYSAEASNDLGHTIEASGFRDGRQAQRWALEVMPDASKLTLRTNKGQARGWYQRQGGVGEWSDVDVWQKSV